MRILGVIPARFASTRLPGKPLADIGGKTLIQRVYEQASLSRALTEVVVATDDGRIESAVNAFGGKVQMTRPDHLNGTSRLIEVADSLDPFDAYVNIQGDEPFISPGQIDLACKPLLDQSGSLVSTLVKRISDFADLQNPNVVKVAIGQGGKALYFSRSPIPFVRDQENFSAWEKAHGFFKHIGIYGFTGSALNKIERLEPSPLELAESLEQLRWLEHGLDIITQETKEETLSVDTPADLEEARKYIKEHEQ